jgi:fumarylacetoacetase
MQELKTWLDIPNTHDFSIYNIPFGVFYSDNNFKTARCGSALGDYIIDLNMLHHYGYLDNISNLNKNIFEKNKLNDFLELGNQTSYTVRKEIQKIFSDPHSLLKNRPEHLNKILLNSQTQKMLLPIDVKDYVDFYSSLDHATNVGKMFRDENNPLLPNWKHIPIGYHGRSGSIVVSGTNFPRPHGQLCAPNSTTPSFGPSQQLDFELEMAFITSKNTSIGDTITPNNAKDAIFGLTLFNDWSARDIQRWEYVPLGPFLGKSFASSMSPWIVTLDALEPFALPPLKKETPELEYLKCSKNGLYDITLEVYLQSKNMTSPMLLVTSNYKHMYWNLLQQLAHMTSNGTPIRVGDLYASGTISGATRESFGSMLEIAWKGTQPIFLSDGTTRTFLHDGDTIVMKGFAQNDNFRVGFGSLFGTILSD